MVEIGYKSGCLKVISNDFALNNKNIIKSVKPIAEQQWLNNFYNCNFINYYKLNKTETQAFKNKLSMPESFIEKFLKTKLKNSYWCLLTSLENVLWQKKNPNTMESLAKSILNHEIYEVECTICGKHYFIDEKSLCCVKRRSCSGAKCLSKTLADKKCNYNNLCNINNEGKALEISNTQLAIVEDITQPLSYYGGNDQIEISYISDIHIEPHLQDNLLNQSNIKKFINNIVKNLYSTMSKTGIIIFAGDISSSTNITLQFYKSFVRYNDYLEYKNKKQKLLAIQEQSKYININKDIINAKITKFEEYINKLKQQISEYLDFKIVIQYKNRHHKYDSWKETISCYKKLSSYISKEIENKCGDILNLLAEVLDLLEVIKSRYYKILDDYNILSDIELTYNKPVKDIKIKNVYTKHHLLSENRYIFAVLGNHEYRGFNSIQDTISFFDNELKMLGIKLLQNNYYEIDIRGNDFIIFGGTGFAKYNKKFNANSLICCNNFSRDIEIVESTLFENEYRNAKKISKNNSACFICVSHYPIQDCMNYFDSDTIYFYGHNHQNYYCKNENKIVYADNQIGYINPNIGFKSMSTGLDVNPYFTLNDGLYETTIEDYLQFYKYLGESIGDGSLLYQRCQNDKASIYIIKRKGYYGFFIVNYNNGNSKGISIVNGGKTKKITKSTDLQWLFDNFEVVLYKYLKILAPLRNTQEQISKELKLLGLDGFIHGCIVDIDYYHHVMLNPIDGSMYYYFSSAPGFVRPLSSFNDVISSMKNMIINITFIDHDLLLSEFNNLKKNTTCLLSKIDKSYRLESFDESPEFKEDEQSISLSSGIYGISRRVNPLQRLFTGRVLRDFDLKLVEYQPTIETNTKSK